MAMRAMAPSCPGGPYGDPRLPGRLAEENPVV